MTIKEFQHEGLPWDELAKKSELSAVLDPDGSSRKNHYIHSIHLEILRRGLNRVQKGNILDFGCGTGRVSRWLALHKWNVLGVDISAGMITKARELTMQLSGVAYKEFDGLHIPSENTEFEAVITVYVLQYAVRNNDLLISIAGELFRVLKPGGKIICIEITDNKLYTTEKYRDILTSNGFNLIHDEPVRLRFGRFMALSEKNFIPMAFIPLLGRLGIMECRWKYQHNEAPDDWHDHFYVFEKK
jgi:ubiquinone/menaquinone biosynthesis C-methylase UbiE